MDRRRCDRVANKHNRRRQGPIKHDQHAYQDNRKPYDVVPQQRLLQHARLEQDERRQYSHLCGHARAQEFDHCIASVIAGDRASYLERFGCRGRCCPTCAMLPSVATDPSPVPPLPCASQCATSWWRGGHASDPQPSASASLLRGLVGRHFSADAPRDPQNQARAPAPQPWRLT